MQHEVSAIGLVGLSFSGSTVLNYVLGSHPGVYGGSELFRLIDPDQEQRWGCSWCHEGCPVLTEERIARLNKENFYLNLAEYTQKNYIVDTSKTLSWFEEMFPLQARRGVGLSLLLLAKHPLRQLAAFMGWQKDYLFTCGLRSVAKRALLDPRTILSRRKMHLSYWLDVSTAFYDGFDASPLLKDVPHRRISYEDFVERPGQALGPVLAEMGLEFDPASINYHTFEQHGVGGNGGVVRMIQPEDRRERFRARSSDYILDYYDNCEGLMMDNTYRQAFSEQEIDWIASLDKYKKLCARLGYAERID